MAVMHVVGNQLISQKDFFANHDAFITQLANEPGAIAFQPIGTGKPLVIDIREVYLGRVHGDIAVVSGVKNYEVIKAASRGLNFLASDQKQHTRIKSPSALSDGTPVVFYSPAIATDSVSLSFELGVGNFPQSQVANLGDAFVKAGGLPLLIPYSEFIVGAGLLLKVAAGLGHALVDGTKFRVDDVINFRLAGERPAVADFRVLVDTTKFTNLADYKYSIDQGLVKKADGTPYNGDEPYLVIGIDGRENDELKGFAAMAASAGVLEQYFRIKDGANEDLANEAITSVATGFQLISDLKYRNDADNLKKRIAGTTDDTQKAELQKEYDAAVKNIQTKELIPT